MADIEKNKEKNVLLILLELKKENSQKKKSIK